MGNENSQNEKKSSFFSDWLGSSSDSDKEDKESIDNVESEKDNDIDRKEQEMNEKAELELKRRNQDLLLIDLADRIRWGLTSNELETASEMIHNAFKEQKLPDSTIRALISICINGIESKPISLGVSKLVLFVISAALPRHKSMIFGPFDERYSNEPIALENDRYSFKMILSSLPSKCVATLWENTNSSDPDVASVNLAILSILHLHPLSQKTARNLTATRALFDSPNENLRYFAWHIAGSAIADTSAPFKMDVFENIIVKCFETMATPGVSTPMVNVLMRFLLSGALFKDAFYSILHRARYRGDWSKVFWNDNRGFPMTSFLLWIFAGLNRSMDVDGAEIFGHLTIPSSRPAPELASFLMFILINNTMIRDDVVTMMKNSRKITKRFVNILYRMVNDSSKFVASMGILTFLRIKVDYPTIVASDQIARINVEEIAHVEKMLNVEHILRHMKSLYDDIHGIDRIMLEKLRSPTSVDAIFDVSMSLVLACDCCRNEILRSIEEACLNLVSSALANDCDTKELNSIWMRLFGPLARHSLRPEYLLRVCEIIYVVISNSEFHARELASAGLMELLENVLYFTLCNHFDWITTSTEGNMVQILVTRHRASNRELGSKRDSSNTLEVAGEKDVPLRTISLAMSQRIDFLIATFAAEDILVPVLGCLRAFSTYYECLPHLSPNWWVVMKNCLHEYQNVVPGSCIDDSVFLDISMCYLMKEIKNNELETVGFENDEIYKIAMLRVVKEFGMQKYSATVYESGSQDGSDYSMYVKQHALTRLQYAASNFKARHFLIYNSNVFLMMEQQIGFAFAQFKKKRDNDWYLYHLLLCIKRMLNNPNKLLLWTPFDSRGIVNLAALGSRETLEQPVRPVSTSSSCTKFSVPRQSISDSLDILKNDYEITWGHTFIGNDCFDVTKSKIVIVDEAMISVWVQFDHIYSNSKQQSYVLAASSTGDYIAAVMKQEATEKQPAFFELGCFHANTSRWMGTGFNIQDLERDSWHHISICVKNKQILYTVDSTLEFSLTVSMTGRQIVAIGNSLTRDCAWGTMADLKIYPFTVNPDSESWANLCYIRYGWGPEASLESSAQDLPDSSLGRSDIIDGVWEALPPDFTSYIMGSFCDGAIMIILVDILRFCTQYEDLDEQRVRVVALECLAQLLISLDNRITLLSRGIWSEILEVMMRSGSSSYMSNQPSTSWNEICHQIAKFLR